MPRTATFTCDICKHSETVDAGNSGVFNKPTSIPFFSIRTEATWAAGKREGFEDVKFKGYKEAGIICYDCATKLGWLEKSPMHTITLEDIVRDIISDMTGA